MSRLSSPLERRPKSLHGYGPPRATALSSAPRKFERSRGPNDFDPAVDCPDERGWSIRLRVASAIPIDLTVKRFPLSDDVGSRFDAPAGGRNIRRNDDCFLVGPFGDP